MGNAVEKWTEEQMSVFSQAVSKIDIPELTMNTTQSQYRGLMFDIPTRLENGGELTLTFNENSEMELYSALRDRLYYTSYNDGYTIDENSTQSEDGTVPDSYMLYYAPFSLSVRLYDPADKDSCPTYSFFFHNCFITNISEVEFSYNNEEVVEYTVKIHYNFRFEGLDAESYIERVNKDKKAPMSVKVDTNANRKTNTDGQFGTTIGNTTTTANRDTANGASTDGIDSTLTNIADEHIMGLATMDSRPL